MTQQSNISKACEELNEVFRRLYSNIMAIGVSGDKIIVYTLTKPSKQQLDIEFHECNGERFRIEWKKSGQMRLL